MNAIVDLQDKLRTNTAAIGKLESALVDHPDSPVIQANLRSLRKLQDSLSDEFSFVAREMGIDVCSYRMLEDRPSARALAEALAGFQEAFSLVFESIRRGPVARRHLSRVALETTDFRVAYTFPGSFGVALTVPRDRFLFQEWPTKADEAMGVVFDIARAKSPGQVSQFARQLGRAPLSAIYEWAKDNAQNRTGADVQWNLGADHPKSLLVQYPEFQELSRSIEETSEETSATKNFSGSLVGADTQSLRFHFVTEDDLDIRGRFTDAISESQKAQLPARYVATVGIHTKVNFARGEDEVTYNLLKLSAIE